MEKRISWLVTFFVVVVIISLSGFFNSYIRFLPATGKFPLIIHVHFIAFLFWFLLLIMQPLLVSRKNYRLHRKLGKLSYLIAPVLVITMLLLVGNRLHRAWPESEKEAATVLLVGLLDIILFSVCYIIAMKNRHNVRWHVAFLIGATLVIFNPGLSRLLNQLQEGRGLLAAVVMPYFIPLLIIMIEKIKYKRPVFKSPYLLFIALWSVEVLLFVILPQTSTWMHIAESIKDL